MGQSIFDQNAEILINRYKNITRERLEEFRSQESNVKVEQAKSGEYIPVIQFGEKILRLNSKYRARTEAEKWAQETEQPENLAAMIMFGLGNGLYVEEKVKNSIQTSRIIVYEPNPQIFVRLMENADMRRLFQDGRVNIVVNGLNETDLMHVLFYCVDYANLSSTVHLVHPYYDELYLKEYRDFLQEIRDHLSLSVIQASSELKYASFLQKNIQHNFKHFPYCQGINQYKNCIPKEVPVIIVSAGPSLSKNVNELKRAKGKAVILATDTAVRALTRADIVPDMIMSIDPRKSFSMYWNNDCQESVEKYKKYVQEEIDKGRDRFDVANEIWGDVETKLDGFNMSLINVPLICGIASRYAILNRNLNRKIIFDTGYDIEEEIFRICRKDIGRLESGGSVANDLFSFALHMGAKTVILIGQDLAYTGGKRHADGIFTSEKGANEKSYRFQVEDIYGNMVGSREDYYQYLLWFNNMISRLPDEYTVIDATEGGAKIEKTQIMTLKEAIDTTCNCTFDMGRIVEETPALLNDEEKSKMISFLEEMPSRLNKIKRKAKEGIECNQQLKRAVERNHYETPSTLKVVKKLAKINKFLDEAPDMAYLLQYMKEVEMEVNRESNKVYDDVYDEVKDVSERQIKMMTAMADSVDKMGPDVEEMIRLVHWQRDVEEGRIIIHPNSKEIF